VQDPSIGQRMINARAETLLEKPSFKQLVPTRRCLVPTDGFYEWRREANRKVAYVDSSEEPRAVRLCRAVGLLARPCWRQGALLFHDHHHRAERAVEAD
jgi:putative SOS response-associated peptidase YedK